MNDQPAHESWLERVLGYEDLSPEARAETDAHLASCAGCRALRARLLRGEAAALATPRVSDPLEAESAPGAAAGEREERESREALLRRAAARRQGWWRHARWVTGIAAAAALVLIVVLPRRTWLPPVSGGRIEPYSGVREVPSAAWRVGDAFRLRIRLERAGYPVVFAVDEAGAVIRLYPGGEGPQSRRFAAGDVVLPPEDGDLRWTFAGDPGRQTFLVAVATGGPADAAGYEADAARAAAGAGGAREAVVTAVRLALERRTGTVLRLDATYGR